MKKRTKRYFRILLFAAVLLLAIKWISGVRSSASRRTIDSNQPMVALTFDDGPCPGASDRILDCLEANSAVATFFEVGSNVEQYPEITKRADALGCESGSHTYGHIDLSSADEEVMKQDLALCDKVFKSAMGRSPKIMRPPGGALSGTAKRYLDLPFFGWSLDTEDWRTRSAEATVQSVRNFGDLDGQVILMHSIYDSSADAACEIIPLLLEEGYQLVTVSELLEYRYDRKPESHIYYTVDFFLYGADPN